MKTLRLSHFYFTNNYGNNYVLGEGVNCIQLRYLLYVCSIEYKLGEIVVDWYFLMPLSFILYGVGVYL